MTRTALPYSAPDLSALARLLARARGHRNLHELRAATTQSPAPPPVPATATPALAVDRWFDAPAIVEPEPSLAPPAPVLSAHAKKALEQFDAAGRLEHWPPKL